MYIYIKKTSPHLLDSSFESSQNGSGSTTVPFHPRHGGLVRLRMNTCICGPSYSEWQPITAAELLEHALIVLKILAEGEAYLPLDAESSGVVDDPLAHPGDGLSCTFRRVAQHCQGRGMLCCFAHSINAWKGSKVKVAHDHNNNNNNNIYLWALFWTHKDTVQDKPNAIKQQWKATHRKEEGKYNKIK